MKPRTLVADRRYYGLDAVTLRNAAGRVAARVAGLPPERARVRGAFLRQDFGMGDTVEGRALLDEMCTAGLLERPPGPTSDFLVTPRMLELAQARVVEPLPRAKAKALVVRACELAERVNRNWARNPLEIADVTALFPRSRMVISLRRGIYARRYVTDFIAMLAPQWRREAVLGLLHGAAM